MICVLLISLYFIGISLYGGAAIPHVAITALAALLMIFYAKKSKTTATVLLIVVCALSAGNYPIYTFFSGSAVTFMITIGMPLIIGIESINAKLSSFRETIFSKKAMATVASYITICGISSYYLSSTTPYKMYYLAKGYELMQIMILISISTLLYIAYLFSKTRD